MKEFFLYPSSIFVSAQDYKVITILGSCVAVTLWDKELRLGGINHFLLPKWSPNSLRTPMYGDIAMEMLLQRVRMLGSEIKNLEAKIFGGAKVLDKISSFDIGKSNVEIAIEFLEALKIPIISRDVGGNSGRKIIFFTKTGKVLLKYINTLQK